MTQKEPIQSRYTPEFPEILRELRCTLAVSTYRSGEILFLSPTQHEFKIAAYDFARPMGISVSDQRIAIATRDAIVIYESDGTRNDDAGNADRNSRFALKHRWYTGAIDTHDIAWGTDALWAVNTRYCCLCDVDDENEFAPRWKPSFITQLTPEDKCHLNGLAVVDGKPAYATAVAATDTPHGWRRKKAGGGILMDIATGEIITSSLSMPHSPRVVDDTIFLLNSGSGDVLAVDSKTGVADEIVRLPGFARGMATIDSYLIVGLSRPRHNGTFRDLPLDQAKVEPICGIAIINVVTGTIDALLEFTEGYDELYDVHILRDVPDPILVEG